MLLKPWDELPAEIRTEAVRPYFDRLKKRTVSLLLKRFFDFIMAILLIIILSPVILAVAILIKLDSPGGVFFSQVRVTQFGKKFKILKFRTMVKDAEKLGTSVTLSNDLRITHVGKFIRRCRLDELPQLFNILIGDMTLVGTRPEVPRYVAAYTDEMWATLLLPAGVTSTASIYYKDESNLLKDVANIDTIYIEKIMSEKMHYNLKALKDFSFWNDIKVIFMTILAVLGKTHHKFYREEYSNK